MDAVVVVAVVLGIVVVLAVIAAVVVLVKGEDYEAPRTPPKKKAVPGKVQPRPGKGTTTPGSSATPRSFEPPAKKSLGDRFAERDPIVSYRPRGDGSRSGGALESVHMWLRPDANDPHRVERGSSRWATGLAIVAVSVLLALAASLEWGHISAVNNDGTATASMSGLGAVDVSFPLGNDPIRDTVERNEVEQLESGAGAPGVWLIILGVVAAVAGAALTWLRPRTEAAVAAAVAGLVGFVVCLTTAINIKGMFGYPWGWNGDYTAGFGLLSSCVLTLVLAGLGGTALVLERMTVGDRRT